MYCVQMEVELFLMFYLLLEYEFKDTDWFLLWKLASTESVSSLSRHASMKNNFGIFPFRDEDLG